MVRLGQAGSHWLDKIMASWLAGWQAFVVAGDAAVLADPGERSGSTTHLRGSTSKACGLRLAMTQMVIFNLAAQVVSLPV